MLPLPSRWRLAALLGSVVIGASGAGFVAAGSATASSVRSSSSKSVLLALGDSLAAGYQPTDGHALPPLDTTTGFRDQGYPGSYAAVVAKRRGLKLVDLGCPGETSTSMMATAAQAACATLYHDEFDASSQLAAAQVFLARHPGTVGVVTLDIGVNDLDHCVSSTSVNASCLASASGTLEKNLTTILTKLTSTLHHDDPSARLVTMNYYDPFLAFAENPGGTRGEQEAAESLVALNAFNAEVGVSAKAFHLSVANVAGAFGVNTVLPLTSYDKKLLPADVATTCRLTWMCPTGKGTSPDIHPDAKGYQTIASAFEAALAKAS